MAVVSHTTVSAIEVLPEDAHNARLLAQAHPRDWRNPIPHNPYNLVVIGAGPAGLIAAAGAAGLGARVALVERHLMGGTASTTAVSPVRRCYAAPLPGLTCGMRVSTECITTGTCKSISAPLWNACGACGLTPVPTMRYSASQPWAWTFFLATVVSPVRVPSTSRGRPHLCPRRDYDRQPCRCATHPWVVREWLSNQDVVINRHDLRSMLKPPEVLT